MTYGFYPQTGLILAAQIRREGYPPLSKSFASKADAMAWARDKERSIDRAELPMSIRELNQVTVGDLLKRYHG
jgi:hypothetical protein